MLDILRKPPGVIDRAIDLEAVCFTDMKVVGTMPRRRVDTARAGFAGRFVLEPNIQLNLGVGLAQ